MCRQWLVLVIVLVLSVSSHYTNGLEFVTMPRDLIQIKTFNLPLFRLIPYSDYKTVYNLRYQPVERVMRENGFMSTIGSQTDLLNSTNEVPTKISSTSSSTTTTTTTSSTIMKPTRNKIEWKNFFKFAGSPTQANLIEKLPAATQLTKSKGFLNIFEVIKFENSKCSIAITDIRSLDGICYHEFECKSLGGSAMGRCAGGVGVCCIFIKTCGMTTNQFISYFESPNYPNPVTKSLVCVLIVELQPKTEQILLDFLMFELNRPTDGDCIDDQFIISGQNMNFIVPQLCGINTGQHMYIPVNNAMEHRIFLSVFVQGTSPRSFNIRVTQLQTDLAPDGCLQFYTDWQGSIKSFNYDVIGTIVDNVEATYLNNLNYAICIKRSIRSCSIVYATDPSSSSSSSSSDFQIINKDEDQIDIVPDGQAGVGIFNCPDDYIGINQVRLCGERFNDASNLDDYTRNAQVTDVSAGPIILPFRTDSAYVGRGFHLTYQQDDCV